MVCGVASALKWSRHAVPWEKVRQACVKALGTDDSAVQYAHAMQLALLAEQADLCGPAFGAARFEQTVEDVLAQADLVDASLLQVFLLPLPALPAFPAFPAQLPSAFWFSFIHFCPFVLLFLHLAPEFGI